MDKGKGRDPLEGPGLPLPQAHFKEILDQDYDLFNPPPLPPNPTGPQIWTTLKQNSDVVVILALLHTMDMDSDPSVGQAPPDDTPYSCPDPGAAMVPLN